MLSEQDKEDSKDGNPNSTGERSIQPAAVSSDTKPSILQDELTAEKPLQAQMIEPRKVDKGDDTNSAKTLLSSRPSLPTPGTFPIKTSSSAETSGHQGGATLDGCDGHFQDIDASKSQMDSSTRGKASSLSHPLVEENANHQANDWLPSKSGLAPPTGLVALEASTAGKKHGEKSLMTSTRPGPINSRATDDQTGDYATKCPVPEELDGFEQSLPGRKGFADKGSGLGAGARHYVGRQNDVEHGDVVAVEMSGERLAVARPVQEEDEDAKPHAFIPSAIEYDPHAKLATSRPRKNLLLVCGVTGLVLVGAAVVLGVLLGKGSDDAGPGPLLPTAAPTHERDTLGLRSAILEIVGAERLADAQGPYARALQWIMYEDPLALTPTYNKTFFQRYFAAYLYLVTSQHMPWASCGPPATYAHDVDSSKGGNSKSSSSSSCIYHQLIMNGRSVVDDLAWVDTLWIRWMSDQPECAWAGVVCDNMDQIRELQLGGLNWTGSYPEGLRFFPFLQTLDAPLGQLVGTLPTEMTNSKYLQHLDFSMQSFTGSIPLELWSMRSLSEIGFASNHLTGPFPEQVIDMIDIKSLTLYKNELTGTIPTQVGLLKGMYYFDLDVNQLHGTIPTEFGQCSSLYRLGLSQNNLSGTIPTEIGHNKNSQAILLSYNNLTGTIPEEIYHLPLLERVLVDHNMLAGTLSSFLGNMTILSLLYVQDNKLTGTIPSELRYLTGLQQFLLNGNDFHGTMPPTFCLTRSKIFVKMAADCAVSDPPPGTASNVGNPEIVCPSTCCTTCCDSEGMNCKDTRL